MSHLNRAHPPHRSTSCAGERPDRLDHFAVSTGRTPLPLWLQRYWGVTAIALAIAAFGLLEVLTVRAPDGATYQGTVESVGVVQAGRWHWHPQHAIAVVRLDDGRVLNAEFEQGHFARVGEHVVVRRFTSLLGFGFGYWI